MSATDLPAPCCSIMSTFCFKVRATRQLFAIDMFVQQDTTLRNDRRLGKRTSFLPTTSAKTSLVIRTRHTLGGVFTYPRTEASRSDNTVYNALWVAIATPVVHVRSLQYATLYAAWYYMYCNYICASVQPFTICTVSCSRSARVNMITYVRTTEVLQAWESPECTFC